MPKALLHIDAADHELVRQLRAPELGAGISLTQHYSPGYIEKKSWPPPPEDVDFVLEWVGSEAAGEVARWLVLVLGGRVRQIWINRRSVDVREVDVLEVLQDARGEES